MNQLKIDVIVCVEYEHNIHSLTEHLHQNYQACHSKQTLLDLCVYNEILHLMVNIYSFQLHIRKTILPYMFVSVCDT